MLKSKLESLLLVKLTALGDVVMTLPTLELLLKDFPNLKVDWLVEDSVADLLVGHPKINKVIIFPRKLIAWHFKERNFFKALKVIWAFIKELRHTKYDVILDLQGLLKSAIWVFLGRSPRKIGFENSKEYTAWALKEKMPVFDIEEHAAKRYLKAAFYLGASSNIENINSYYQPSESYMQKAEKLLAFKNNKEFIVFNHATKWASKNWPLDKWEDLGQLLVENNKYNIVLTGTKTDFEKAEIIKRNILTGENACLSANKNILTGENICLSANKNIEILNICGQTNLKVLAAVLKKAKRVVTGDTGPMHLAAAVGAKGAALFGPTKYWRTGPFGGKFEIMLVSDLNCLYCLEKTCTHHSCLKNLTALRVFQALNL